MAHASPLATDKIMQKDLFNENDSHSPAKDILGPDSQDTLLRKSTTSLCQNGVYNVIGQGEIQ